MLFRSADGHEAIAKVSQLKPDLVVLDFAMPGLNGFETARKIVAQFPNLPIILYTFYGIEGMNIEAQKHGISEVVDKTASGDQLLATIEKHLGRRANAAATASETIVQPEDKEEEPQGLN